MNSFNAPYDEERYNKDVAVASGSPQFPFVAALTYFEPNSDSYVFSYCLDAETLS